ncbi:hypothetical protein [Dermacoccus barathri]|uniref:hypothetical protein n=1 Tax=Dermacoccus barathri TaxID=322601 RepID=UPI0039EC3420
MAVAFAGVLALSVSACGGGSSSSDSSKSDTSAASSKSGDAKASGSAAAGSDVNAKDPKRDANADLVIWADGTAAPVVSKLAKQVRGRERRQGFRPGLDGRARQLRHGLQGGPGPRRHRRRSRLDG